MTPTQTVPECAVTLAIDTFGENAQVVYVGGSHARGTARPGSDIDLVVLLRESHPAAEERFAHELHALHDAAGLSFDHCGEVFDLATLAHLLAFTEAYLAVAPAIQLSACYQADCELSIFRKGDVVFKFLADPKTHVHDPTGILPGLERRAADYFSAFPLPRVQRHKGRLKLEPGTAHGALSAEWAGLRLAGRWSDTPVGTDLGRWFGRQLGERARLLPSVIAPREAACQPHRCPLQDAPWLGASFALQCIAYPPTTPKE